MFATLLGALPRPSAAGETAADIENAMRAQEQAGLEPLTDGRLGWQPAKGDPDPVRAWRAAATLTSRAVKQTLPGPYSRAWRSNVGAGSSARSRSAQAHARAIRSVIEDLVAAGCPLVEIEEGEAHRIGA